MPNVFLYPAAFTSEHLLFRDTSIRHFVVGPRIAEAFFFPTPEAVLRDGDKQTFLHDLDGTLTGFAGMPHMTHAATRHDTFFDCH
jgi:hypothetical protein